MRLPSTLPNQNLVLRSIMLGLCFAAIALFVALTHMDSVHAKTLPQPVTSPHHRIASSPLHLITPSSAAPRTELQQGGIISTIQSIFNYVINATVYFPAKTFQEAVEKATRNIFTGQLDVLRAPLREVIQVYAFANSAVFGNLAIPTEVRTIGTRLTQAAVPIWVLSLVLLGMAALTRSAVGMGYGSTDIAAEGARWFFIALASGNGASIVNLVHTGFGALTYAIASSGGSVSAAEFVGVFIPSVDAAKVWPILVLVIGTVLGLITVIVLAVTYLARYTLLLAITGLAPLCIACEGIPFTRFVFRDWISIFLRLEFLQIINVTVLVIFKAIGFVAAAHGGGVTQAILMLTVMLGLSSALIGINVSVFKQVFGTAIDVAAQMKSAGEQMVRVMGQLAGVAAGLATGGAGSALPALASAGALGGPAASQSPDAATSNSTQGQNVPSNLGGIARAVGQATGSPFLRGFADGASAASDNNRQRAAATRVIDQQRQADQRRGESLAREMGATASDDVEAIAQSINTPPAGRSREQMMRAHRDNAGLLHGMTREYGSPGRAAAVGGYPNFAAMALAMAEERLGETESVPTSQPHSDGQPSPQQTAQSMPTKPTTERQDMPARLNGVTTSGALTASNTTSEPAHDVAPDIQQRPSATPSHTRAAPSIDSSGNGPILSNSQAAIPAMTSPRPSNTVADGAITSEIPATPNSKQASHLTTPTSITPASPTPNDNPLAGQMTQPVVQTAAPSTPSQAPDMITATPMTLSTPSPTQTPAATSSTPSTLLPPPTPPITENTPAPEPLNEWLAQVPPAPIQGWVQTPPSLTDPGSHNMTPYDFGVGATLARNTQSSPTHTALWAQTAHDLRMSFGEEYVKDLLTQTGQHQLNENQLMTQIDTQLASTPSVRSVNRFWIPNTH